MQRSSAGADADRMLDSAVSRELFFECSDLFAQHELAAFEHARDGVVDFRLQLAILCAQIQQRNHDCPPKDNKRRQSLRKIARIESGGMAEWLKAAVLKTVSGVTRSGVRIPLPPPGVRP